MPKQTFTAEQRAAYKEKKQEEIAAMTADIEKGIQDVFQSDKYKDYLRVMSKFTNYSLNNTLLIAMQKPDASLVAAFGKWKELGRTVNKGEKGIYILAPVKYNTNVNIETEVPVTDKYGNKLYNDDGTEKTEIISEPVKELRFKTVSVFDVSQTSGKPIPSITDELTGDVDEDRMNAIMEGVRKAAGVPVGFEEIRSGAKGYYSPADKRIAIKSGMSDLQTLKTAFHETAHCLLHDPDTELATSKITRDEKEVQAESVAYIVASRYGIDTSEYSFPYVASWSDGKELKELKNYLQEVQSAAKKICDKIDSELIKLRKRDLNFDEIAADNELSCIGKTEMLIGIKEKSGVFISDSEKEDLLKQAETIKPDEYNVIAQRINNISGYPKIDVSPHFLVPEFEKKCYSVSEFNAVLAKANDRWQSDDKNEGKSAKIKMTIHLSETESHERELPMEECHEKLSDFLAYRDTTGMFEDLTEAIRNAESVVSTETAVIGNQEVTKTAVDGIVKGHEISAKITTEVKNSNVIGNTPYKELGDKKDLHYYNIPSEHIDGIAEKLDKAGIKFSGLHGQRMGKITINKADTDRYKEIAAEYKAELSAQNKTAEKREKYGIGDKTAEIIDPAKHTYNAHAAALIAKELSALGVKFTGTKEDKHTTIIVSAADEQLFQQAVNNAKAKAQKQPADKSYKDIPLVMSSYNDAKAANDLHAFYNSLNALKACEAYISMNIDTAFRERKTSDFCKELEERFGADKAMYVIGKALTDKNDIPKALETSIGRYDFNIKSFKPLADISAHMLKSLYNDIMERNKMFEKAPDPVKLNNYFDDKHFMVLPHKSLETDDRGFPVTVMRENSINERYVKGYGWLDNQAFFKALRESSKPDEFRKLVEKCNVTYVDDNGRIGRADMTQEESNELYKRTFSESNRERYEAAKTRYNERIAELPQQSQEYYAVTHISENRYAIMSIGADGTTEAVTGKLTKDEAVKAMNELYESKEKSGIDVQIVSPEKLSKLSVDIYKSQKPVEREPERLFKVFPNPIKGSPADQSHFVQAYKKEGDRYKEVGVAIVGTLDKCQKFAKEAMRHQPSPTYKIYQLKSGEENHNYRFAGTAELAKFGMKIEYPRYEQIYEAPLSDVQKKDLATTLNGIYNKFNIDRPNDFKGHSLSVSDVVILDKSPYFVDSKGFKKIQNFLPEQKIEYLQEQFMKDLDRRVNEAQTPEQLQNIAKEGQKLGLDIKFTEFKPSEKLSEITNSDDKEPSRAKPKKPRL